LISTTVSLPDSSFAAFSRIAAILASPCRWSFVEEHDPRIERQPLLHDDAPTACPPSADRLDAAPRPDQVNVAAERATAHRFVRRFVIIDSAKPTSLATVIA